MVSPSVFGAVGGAIKMGRPLSNSTDSAVAIRGWVISAVFGTHCSNDHFACVVKCESQHDNSLVVEGKGHAGRRQPRNLLRSRDALTSRCKMDVEGNRRPIGPQLVLNGLVSGQREIEMPRLVFAQKDKHQR